jgi:hypothetical protein
MPLDFENEENCTSNDKSLGESKASIDADDDLLSDLDMTSEIETPEALMSDLDASDENAIEIATASSSRIGPSATPIASSEEWMDKIREVARDHGPFAPHEIVQIIRELNRAPDPTSGAEV